MIAKISEAKIEGLENIAKIDKIDRDLNIKVAFLENGLFYTTKSGAQQVMEPEN